MKIKFFEIFSDTMEKKYFFIWERRDVLLNVEPRKRGNVFRVLSTVLVFGCVIFFIFGAKEYFLGHQPIFSKEPNGAVCNDGWRSYSQGPGTCSHHGGVDYYIYDNVYSGIDYSNPFPFLIISLSILSIIISISLFYKSFRWAVYKRFFDIIYYLSIVTTAILSFILYLPMILFVILYIYIEPIIKLFSKNK